MARKENDTREMIFQTAIELMKKDGYNNSTIQDICQKSGVSKNTFYYYFDSKEALLSESYRRINHITLERLNTIISAENYVQQLWLLDEPIIDFCVASGADITKRFFTSRFIQESGHLELGQLQTTMIQTQVSILRQAQKNKQMNNMASPETLIHCKNRLLFGTTIEWCFTNGGFDLKKEIRQSIEALLDIAAPYRAAVWKGDLPDDRN